MDYCRQINSIQYIQINSTSYFWMGSEYQHVRYGPQIDRDYPWIKYTAPYAQPLFALVTLAPDGTITIEGTQSKWVGPSPWDVGYPQDHRERITPRVSSRRLQTALKQPSASANRAPLHSVWFSLNPERGRQSARVWRSPSCRLLATRLEYDALPARD
jgi:hypothetical protein